MYDHVIYIVAERFVSVANIPNLGWKPAQSIQFMGLSYIHLPCRADNIACYSGCRSSVSLHDLIRRSACFSLLKTSIDIEMYHAFLYAMLHTLFHAARTFFLACRLIIAIHLLPLLSRVRLCHLPDICHCFDSLGKINRSIISATSN